METVILIEMRNVFGNARAYPANVQAERLAALAGQKTLSYGALRLALDMGFTVQTLGTQGQTIVPADAYKLPLALV